MHQSTKTIRWFDEKIAYYTQTKMNYHYHLPENFQVALQILFLENLYTERMQFPPLSSSAVLEQIPQVIA